MKKMSKLLVVSIVLLALLVGCATNKTDTSAGDKTEIILWRGDGTDQEEAFYNKQIEEFNASQDKYVVKAEVFPYTEIAKTARAAVATKGMPDIMFLDDTDVSNMAFSEVIIPLDDIVKELPEDISDSAFTGYKENVYGISQQEGGLGFWANKSYLEKAGVRIPTYDTPWNKAEFDEALEKLSNLEEIDYPLDIKANFGSGYVAYAWQPIIKSFGGDWYNEDTITADGALNGEKTVEALTYIQELSDKGYINSNQTSDTELIEKRAALDLTGHWNYNDYKAALGDDLVLLPLPDFGNKSQTGVGGIAFTITKYAEETGKSEGAAEFIKFALQDTYQSEINSVNGSLPVNMKILETIDHFKEGGDLYLYAQQLEGENYAVRPPSPAFPTFQEEIGRAAFNILHGADPKSELDTAASNIDNVIQQNGY